MKLILLPGNSSHNKEWIEKVERVLNSLFDETTVHYYKHWREGGEINFDHEINVLKDEVKDSGDYAIFAKSVGTYITLWAIKENIIHPKKCIFLGFPYKLFKTEKEKRELDALLKSIDIPVMFIQNSEDPYGSFDEIEDVLKRSAFKDYKTVRLERKSHDYPQYEKIKELVGDFINN